MSTEPQVTPAFKTNQGECEGRQDVCKAEGCPLYGTLGRPARDEKRRVRGCNDPVARGKRNRAKGDSKARKGRKQLGLVGANTRHEELWGGPVRTESKAGAGGGANAVWTHYRNARAQSEVSRAIGDVRPFVAMFHPDKTSQILYVIGSDELEAAVAAMAEAWGFVGMLAFSLSPPSPLPGDDE